MFTGKPEIKEMQHCLPPKKSSKTTATSTPRVLARVEKKGIDGSLFLALTTPIYTIKLKDY
jgi:hypothetical protein